MSDSDSLIPAHGGYHKLRSFQAAQLAYDATLVFCERFVDRRSRTLAAQLLRSATSVGANVEEAQAGQSRADFYGEVRFCPQGGERGAVLAAVDSRCGDGPEGRGQEAER